MTGSRDDYIAVAVRLVRDEALRNEMSQAVKEMSGRAGLGQSDFIGSRIGDVLWDAYSQRLGSTI